MTQTRTPSSGKQIVNAEGLKRGYGSGAVGRYYHKFPTPDCPLISMFFVVKYFRQEPNEPRPPLADIIGQKLTPAPAFQAVSPLADVRRDFLLPYTAPRNINSIAELITAHDIAPWLRRDIMIEMKFILEAGATAHYAYEAVRGFALQYFARERGLAGIMVLHLPARSGSKAPNHIHLFVPARYLTEEGFGAAVDGLIEDEGCAEVAAAWNRWRR